MTRLVLRSILAAVVGLIVFGIWSFTIMLAAVPARVAEPCSAAPYELGSRPMCVDVGEDHVKRSL